MEDTKILNEILKKITSIGEDVVVMKGDMVVLKEDVSTLKKDVTILKEDVGTLKKDVTILKEDVGTLKKDVTILKEDVGTLKKDVTILKEDVSSLKEDMAFMKDNAVSMDDFNDFKQEVRGEFVKVREEIISHVDGFVNLHKNLDTEQTSLRSKVNRHEVIIQRVVEHVALPIKI